MNSGLVVRVTTAASGPPGMPSRNVVVPVGGAIRLPVLWNHRQGMLPVVVGPVSRSAALLVSRHAALPVSRRAPWDIDRISDGAVLRSGSQTIFFSIVRSIVLFSVVLSFLRSLFVPSFFLPITKMQRAKTLKTKRELQRILLSQRRPFSQWLEESESVLTEQAEVRLSKWWSL